MKNIRQKLRTLALLTLLSGTSGLFAQAWVDTLYDYTQTTVVYGTATDFAGNSRELHLDICIPEGDVPPACGRPVLIAIHGGAFLGGTKNDPTPQQWMKDFAKRGYLTASVEYRLGFFQPAAEIHCNVTNLFGFPWDCINAADTSEWVRAGYRAMQDTKGAIRYLLANSALYGGDPNNVFLAGESAGGFVALGTAFTDLAADKPLDAGAIAPAQTPNNIYNGFCVQTFGWDTSIASMNLARPDLGSINGTLHLNAPPFRIRAVGNFYGAISPTFLENNGPTMPEGLYLYHQPNDLVVPIGTQKVYTGLSSCFTALGCAPIINRPTMSGSGGIKTHIDALGSTGAAVPDYWYDVTNNNADCLAQVLNPAVSGHAIDNYWLRSTNMAQYFSTFYKNCTVSTEQPTQKAALQLFPNPNNGHFTITGIGPNPVWLHVYDALGRKVTEGLVQDFSQVILPESAPNGIYFCLVEGGKVLLIKK